MTIIVKNIDSNDSEHWRIRSKLLSLGKVKQIRGGENKIKEVRGHKRNGIDR